MLIVCILAALAIGALVYLAVKLTIGFLKKYKSRKNSKIFAGFVKDIIKEAPTMKLDDLSDDDVIISEYDEETDELVQDLSVSKDYDEKVKELINRNGGIVVFD